MDHTWSYDSPLGPITLAARENALTGLWFEGQAHYARGLAPAHEERYLPVFAETERWLELYFCGRQPGFTPPLLLQGTPFQQTVWGLLLQIPYGHTETYGALAKKTALLLHKTAMSAQAVGNAVARNPVSLIVPCHRVVGAGGTLTGYAGGPEKKAFLLGLERSGAPITQ